MISTGEEPGAEGDNIEARIALTLLPGSKRLAGAERQVPKYITQPCLDVMLTYLTPDPSSVEKTIEFNGIPDRIKHAVVRYTYEGHDIDAELTLQPSGVSSYIKKEYEIVLQGHREAVERSIGRIRAFAEMRFGSGRYKFERLEKEG